MFEILPDDAPVKLCKDCRFFQANMPQCHAPKNRLPDYVGDGAAIWQWSSAAAARQSDIFCGPTAAWFEAKPPYDND